MYAGLRRRGQYTRLNQALEDIELEALENGQLEKFVLEGIEAGSRRNPVLSATVAAGAAAATVGTAVKGIYDYARDNQRDKNPYEAYYNSEEIGEYQKEFTSRVDEAGNYYGGPEDLFEDIKDTKQARETDYMKMDLANEHNKRKAAESWDAIHNKQFKSGAKLNQEVPGEQDGKGGYHLPGYKYLGPGNDMNRGSPINHVDEHAQQHDKAYETAMNKEDVYKADRTFLKDLSDHIIDGSDSVYETAGAISGVLGIGAKHIVEKTIGKTLYPSKYIICLVRVKNLVNH